MAKSKKRISSSSSTSRRKGASAGSTRTIRALLLTVAYAFLLLCVFNAAGSLGALIHSWMRDLLGNAAFLFGILLIWLALLRFFPERFAPRLFVILGSIIFTMALTGVLHSFQHGDLRADAAAGLGGGYLGFAVYAGIGGLFGASFGRLILFVFLIIGVVLMLDQLVLPLLAGDDENEESRIHETENAVPVTGEIQPTANPIVRRFGRPKAPVMTLEPKKTVLPVVLRSANWNYPPLELLAKVEMRPQAGNIQKRMEIIKKTLADFGVDVTMSDAYVGPTVTQFTMKPSEGVKLNQITAREADLALALAAQSLRVEAPIPGKGAVGVEIPNEKKALVGLRELLDSNMFKAVGSKLALALGRDSAGDVTAVDLARMPHALIAGSTGSGKSVCINSIILTLLIDNSPDELRLILVDPKRVELSGYNGVPHLLTPVITEPKDAVAALAWCVREMERRYKLLQSTGKRNIDQYNQDPDLGEGRLPYIVIIVDELADLMLVAQKEIETSIVRIAQMARAVGIHLIVATQRPSTDVITGLIKANIPTRIAFAVASQIDSRTILDGAGAEKLLGYGDMLYMSTDVPRPRRIQGVWVPEKEITSVVAHIKQQEEGDRYDPNVLETRVESRLGGSRENGEVDDELFQEAVQCVRQYGKASTTLLQTRLSVGYARAARLITNLEDQGIIGPSRGSKPREVYGIAGSDDDEEVGIAAFPERE
jgi:S-DNA-T family DNA segregation ATPase FtsK/SpoIIIE